MAAVLGGAVTSTSAEARGFRFRARHVPIVIYRNGSSDRSSQPQQQEEKKVNPWAKDEPAPVQQAAQTGTPTGSSSGWMMKLLGLLLFVAAATWGLFKLAVRMGQDSDSDWSPSAPEGFMEKNRSQFDIRVQQQLLNSRAGTVGEAPAPAAQGFGRRMS